ncbi:hypothetical protein O181_021919 [Austropuccinia psidii MF-1]|uniref:Integrase catalytic domain-containing protein n=1 Tax=Austropuccinia psidii MF-1 TaxID=1389203 RepID=A0A9Q3CBM1_9BASI|nr:hypothetical protein [Austropuccinia psidii MF-1]
MIKIQEPRKPWETVHMDWAAGLQPGGDRSYNACLVIVDRFSKTPIFLPCQKDEKAMDTALLIWNRVILWTGIFKISLVTEIPSSTQHYGKISTFFGTILSFSTAYHTQTEGIAERMIQTLENMVRRFCAYGL